MDLYTSDEFQKKANKSALILARTRYNELIAPFVKNSSSRLEFAKDQIEKIVAQAASECDAEADYVNRNLMQIIAEEIKTAESDNKRTMDKGLGVDGEAVKEDLSDAGKSYTGFGEGDGDAEAKGLGVDGDKGGEEASTEAETISIEFSENDAENKDAVEGFGGGPESPSSEIKPVDERPDDVAVKSDISYGGGSVLEDEIRGPSGGAKGPGKAVHDLNENTYKWTKVEDRLISEVKEAASCCGSDCENCSCGGACGADCSCKTSKKKVAKHKEGCACECAACKDSRCEDCTKGCCTPLDKESRYGIPKSHGGDSAANVKKMESCVADVMADGKSKESAIRICKASLFGDKKSSVEKESSEEGHKPTSGMKSAAARAIKWREQGHKGGTNIGAIRARQIVNGESLSDSTVKRMHSFFSRHAVDKQATGFSSGEEGYPSPGRVAWDLWGGDAGASWSARIAERLKKKSSCIRCESSIDEGIVCAPCNDEIVKIAYDGMTPTNPTAQTGQQTDLVKVCPSCGNNNDEDDANCKKCGANIIPVQPTQAQGKPITGSIKEAQLPGGDNQPPTQGTMQQPGPMSMPTAPNPAMMGDQDTQDKPVQDQKFLARTEIANEKAALHFSKIDNLEELSEQIVDGLSQQYNLPHDYVKDHLVVQAQFDQAIASNGTLNKEINLEQYQEVNPSTPTEVAPQEPLNTIKKGATIPLKLILSKIMKEQGIDEVTALNNFKEAYAGQNPPETFDVMVIGELRYYLPKQAIGGSEEQTESPFLPAQAPEDVMDQSYNQVPELPAR